MPHRPTSAALVWAGTASAALLLSTVDATATEAPKDGRPVLALLAVNAGAGFPQGEAESVEALLLSALEATGRLHVIGGADIKTLVDLEAKKEQVGCKEDESCMTAIAGALGADYVASATLGRLGQDTLLAFKVIHVRSATALVHAREMVSSDEALSRAADSIAAQVVTVLFSSQIAGAGPVTKTESARTTIAVPAQALHPQLAAVHSPSPWHTLGIVAAVIGGVGLAAGTGLGIAAQSKTTAIRKTPTAPSVQTDVNQVNTMEAGATVGWAGGGVLAALGAGLLVAF